MHILSLIPPPPLPLNAQIEALERQLRAALDNLEKQKAAAIRWIGRQEIRFMAQSKEVALERSAIAAVIRTELSL